MIAPFIRFNIKGKVMALGCLLQSVAPALMFLTPHLDVAAAAKMALSVKLNDSYPTIKRQTITLK